jgi:hypothetical protein
MTLLMPVGATLADRYCPHVRVDGAGQQLPVGLGDGKALGPARECGAGLSLSSGLA